MFAKIFSSIFDGTLATVGPWEALITFENILILTDKDGLLDMTPDALSRRTTIPLEIILKGIEALEKPDPQSRNPDEEGRRIVRLSNNRPWGWRVVNYAHYRALRTAEDRREYMKAYQREYRKQRKPSVNTCKQNKPIAHASASSLNLLKENFEKFWNTYPSRKGKKHRKGVTQEIYRNLSDADQILAIQAAGHYAASEGSQNGYAKYPERFLKGEKGEEFWRDWLEPEQKTTLNGSSAGKTCTRRLEQDGRLKSCTQPAVATVGKTPMCESCHQAYQMEQEVISVN